jgi:hypothetical protein
MRIRDKGAGFIGPETRLGLPERIVIYEPIYFWIPAIDSNITTST